MCPFVSFGDTYTGSSDPIHYSFQLLLSISTCAATPRGARVGVPRHAGGDHRRGGVDGGRVRGAEGDPIQSNVRSVGVVELV